MGLTDNILTVWKIGEETKITNSYINESPFDYDGWIEQLKINPLLLHATGKLDLYPKIQRRSETWNRKTKRSVLSCLRKGRSIGVITLRYDSETGLYTMVDGSHRMSTILDFIKGKIKFQGKYYHDLSPEKREKFLKCMLHVHIYRDISDEEASELFQQLNSGSSLNEPEKFNSYGNAISDLVRVIANNNHKTDIPPWAEKLLGEKKHKLFTLLGTKWRIRHGHEKIAYTVLYNIFTLYSGKKNIYDKGASNTEEARQKMYQKYGNFGDPSIGQWKEMADDDLGFELQIKIVKEWIRVLDTMHDLVAAAPLKVKSFGTGTTPGGVFWNLYHFVLGLEIDYASKRSIPVIKDPKLFVAGYLKAHRKENIKKSDGTYSVYKSINGKWMPTQHEDRNKIIMKSMKKVGHQKWGISIRDSKRAFSMSDIELRYLNFGGKSEMSGKKMDLKDMDAHHIVAWADGGRSDYDNLQLLGREEHRDEHKPNKAS
jgi:hypothetical protein